jgi:uncharacterized protein YidB (DUF937 family)
MGTTRTLWHVLLATFLSQRAPRRFEVRAEVPLSIEPLRGDMLLLRRDSAPEADAEARTLRGLWHLLPSEALLEFKSVGRPYRRRNLHRLWSYLYIHFCDQPARLPEESLLCGVLLVPRRSPALVADAAALRLHWRELGDGYSALNGGGFALYVAELDVIAEAEHDDLLSFFGHGKPHTEEAQRWLSEQVGSEKVKMALSQMEGFDEVMKKLLDMMPPEQVLSSYTADQRMAGLSAEQLLPALPDEVLRGLSDEYIARLPEPVRSAVRARLRR